MQKLRTNIIRIIHNPLTGFLFYFLCVSVFLLIPPVGAAAIPFYITLPFILFIVFGLNISFLGSLFRGFTISEEKKRNHALEHGTIYFIKKRFGDNFKVGGSATSDGFRICGVSKKEMLTKAFDQFQKEHANRKSALIISKKCGTNLITAQGFGLIMLTLSVILLRIIEPGTEIVIFVLAINLSLYFLLRTYLGNWIQEKLFMSLNFSSARVHSINRVKKKIWWERNPVFFIKTIIE